MTTKLVKKQSFDLENLSQDDIPSMLAAINEKIKQLKAEGSQERETKVSFPDFGVLVKDVKDIDVLIKMKSILIAKEKYYLEAVKEIIPKDRVKNYNFVYAGHTVKQWTEDIKKRTIELLYAKELAKLEESRAILEENLSAKDKLKKDLQKVVEILNEE